MYPDINAVDVNMHMVDEEFDKFELNDDLSATLHEAEPNNFFHDNFDPEERDNLEVLFIDSL